MTADRPGRNAVVALAVALAIALSAAGCGRSSDRPRVALGAPCAACGMPIHDARFACVRGSGGAYRSYDAIECLARGGPAAPGEAIYLADYDTGSLHAADSIWVVRGDFPSPMGAGLAGFLDRASADQVAAETRGRVGRLGGSES